LTFQDIINGEGACLVDPHGDLIEELLGLIPEERKEDVILFEPGNPEVAFGLNNFLSALFSRNNGTNV